MTRDEIMQLTKEEVRLEIAQIRGWGIPHDPRSYPNWPNNISNAWTLLEEMRPHYFQILVMCWDHTDKWVCQCNPRHGHDEIVYHPTSEGDTAAVAISRAWLLWKQEEK